MVFNKYSRNLQTDVRNVNIILSVTTMQTHLRRKKHKTVNFSIFYVMYQLVYALRFVYE